MVTTEKMLKVCPQFFLLLEAKSPKMKSYQKILWLGLNQACECLPLKNMKYEPGHFHCTLNSTLEMTDSMACGDKVPADHRVLNEQFM